MTAQPAGLCPTCRSSRAVGPLLKPGEHSAPLHAAVLYVQALEHAEAERSYREVARMVRERDVEGAGGFAVLPKPSERLAHDLEARADVEDLAAARASEAYEEELERALREPEGRIRFDSVVGQELSKRPPAERERLRGEIEERRRLAIENHRAAGLDTTPLYEAPNP